MENDSRLRQETVLSSIILIQIFRHVQIRATSFACLLLDGVQSENGLITILTKQEIRDVQSTIDRIFSTGVRDTDPRNVRRHAGLSLFDMVLLGNYILMREMAVHIGGRIEFVPTDPQVRATRAPTPMHDLILIFEDLSPENLSADGLEANENLFLQQVGMSLVYQGPTSGRLDLSKRLSPVALRALKVWPSPEIEEEYRALEVKAAAVRSSFFADPRHAHVIPRKKILDILDLDRTLERPSMFHHK